MIPFLILLFLLENKISKQYKSIFLYHLYLLLIIRLLLLVSVGEYALLQISIANIKSDEMVSPIQTEHNAIQLKILQSSPPFYEKNTDLWLGYNNSIIVVFSYITI